jgi:Ca2+-binding EF-hand superfamily protein
MHRTFASTLIVLALAVSGCGDGDDEQAGGEGLAGTTAVDAFSTLDGNGDSYLDADEIAEWVDDEGVFTQWDEDADSEIDEDEISGNAFELWDGDANGTISESEWTSATERWYPEARRPRVFRDWDNDRDSELDRDEVAEHLDLSPLGESWTAAPFAKEEFGRAYFEIYDIDDDGRLTRSEFVQGTSTFGVAQ